MRAIWSDERKFQIWLEIETIACEAMARLGLIPKEDAAVIVLCLLYFLVLRLTAHRNGTRP